MRTSQSGSKRSAHGPTGFGCRELASGNKQVRAGRERVSLQGVGRTAVRWTPALTRPLSVVWLGLKMMKLAPAATAASRYGKIEPTYGIWQRHTNGEKIREKDFLLGASAMARTLMLSFISAARDQMPGRTAPLPWMTNRSLFVLVSKSRLA